MTHPHLLAIGRAAGARRKLAASGMDLDVPAFVRQVKALPVFKDCPHPITRTKVVVVPSAYTGGGYAHGNRMVRIRFAPTTTASWLLGTIVHELVHAALPSGANHGERFRLTLARAARELWGIEVSMEAVPRGKNGQAHRYGLDDLIEKALEPIALAGGYPKRVVVVVDRAETRKRALGALVEKRAAHAARMLAKADRKLKLARTVRAKWQKRTAYYERVAAKRGQP
jgi:hypothetical protein